MQHEQGTLRDYNEKRDTLTQGTIGRLYPLGHATPGAYARLVQLTQEQRALIVDIRTDTRAPGYPGWSQAALSRDFGMSYVYRGHSLSISALYESCGPAEGIPWLISALQKPRHIVLLVKRVEDNVHLAAILKMVKEQVPEVEVVR